MLFYANSFWKKVREKVPGDKNNTCWILSEKNTLNQLFHESPISLSA